MSDNGNREAIDTIVIQYSVCSDERLYQTIHLLPKMVFYYQVDMCQGLFFKRYNMRPSIGRTERLC